MWFFHKKKTPIRTPPVIIYGMMASPMVLDILNKINDKEKDSEYVDVYISPPPNPQLPQYPSTDGWCVLPQP